jgi:S1-C subfamily serine protease
MGFNDVRFPAVRQFLPLAAALGLAACAAADVEMESRTIAVQPDAQPAAAAAISGSIPTLLSQTGPTYVTLTVSERQTEAGGSGNAAVGRAQNVAVTSGSGFVVDPEGYILTAGHVGVKEGNSVSARAANGRLYSGRVVAVRPENDMALIRLKSYRGKAVSAIRDICMSRGSPLYSLGKPHEMGDTARVGQLEAMHFGRAVRYGKFGYPDAMVLRMSTQKGESGGPVFNQSGQLVGMVVSTLSDGNGQSLNLAHAVPATALAQFLCSNMSCSSDWNNLSRQTTDRCPAG